ncbi:RNA polymerase factor sigma-54 [Natranaerobius trueperi]|uniref:RNA polymerase sigma-54 factor n=1 Tax=Natranaerobius trueperi TaxID=759412 RepID=A0A226C0A0_9FIRM|nr:RNA polymerase factor sigma-54 [Natranaerobius trueperi]OWZ83797.1 RNA polymerase sigma-54 factor [Natranaerobius trueperi]
MKLGFDLNLEQKQQLIITPELKKAIELLQLSGMELNNHIEQELAENPMLEVATSEEEPKENETSETFDIDWQKYFEDSSDIGKHVGTGMSENKESFENYTPSSTNLFEHLFFQLSLITTEEYREIAEYLIGNLDPNGYLRGSLEEMSQLIDVKYSELEKALKLVQSLDPPGIGARSLKECLLLQLERKDDYPKLSYKLIENYLIEIGENRLSKIAEKTGESVVEVQKAVDYIKTLTPKPASTFSIDSSSEYISPDIVIKRVEDDYVVIINDSMNPKLKINSMYKSILSKANKNEAADSATKFLNSKLDSALWLIKSIEQRRLTLHNIVNKLIEFQKPFLDNGVSYLRPLTLKQIAEQIGVHESTVSRATANKYVQTPQGVFPLRYFFSSKVENTKTDSSSSTSIKHKIKNLIENEDKKQPLSDQKISEILKESAINISRRTVAKYRKELNIPSSSKRKRYH